MLFFCALKSAIVIDVVAKTSVTFGLLSWDRSCSRIESTFLKPTDAFFCLSSTFLISDS